jgi:hypothetical protein
MRKTRGVPASLSGMVVMLLKLVGYMVYVFECV